MLYQFDQSTGQVGRVDKRDPSAAPTDPRKLVDQARTPRRQVGQCFVDVEHRIRDVVQALTLPLEEPANRRVRRQGAEQLDERPSHRDHRFFHALIGHDLSVVGLNSVSIEVIGDGGVEVVDRDPDVIEVVELHRPKVRRAMSVVENPVLAQNGMDGEEEIRRMPPRSAATTRSRGGR